MTALTHFEPLERRRLLAQIAFDGPHLIDRRVDAEDFDAGGNGVAYFDTSAGNSGDSPLRPGEDVELFTTSDYAGGSKIGLMQPGEWLEYTLTVGEPGEYVIAARLLDKIENSTGLDVGLVAGGAVTPLARLHAAGSPDLDGDGQANDQDFYTARTAPVALPAGQVTLRFTAPAPGNVAFNWFRVETPGPVGGDVVDASTLEGKVLAGYQGWFGTPNSSGLLDYHHYGTGPALRPDNVTVDFWPAVDEYEANAAAPNLPNAIAPTAATVFDQPDGSPARVYDSASGAVIRTHFEWMRDYGIDGAYVKRNAPIFSGNVFADEKLRLRNLILNGVRHEAARTGRVFAVHYDLSGAPDGGVGRVADDWEALVAGGVTGDSRYLHDGGQPIVAVFGVSNFDGRRPYQYDEVLALAQRMKATGAKLILSPAQGWRNNLDHDDGSGVTFGQVLAEADVVRPWTVGYVGRGPDVRAYANQLDADRAWLEARGQELQPVFQAGYSARNLMKNERGRADFEDFLDIVPRRGGDFFWEQADAYDAVGARSAFVAMFDEIDEGTQIFKVDPTPPAGARRPDAQLRRRRRRARPLPAFGRQARRRAALRGRRLAGPAEPRGPTGRRRRRRVRHDLGRLAARRRSRRLGPAGPRVGEPRRPARHLRRARLGDGRRLRRHTRRRRGDRGRRV